MSFPETSNLNLKTIILKCVYHRSEVSFSLSNIEQFCIFLIGLSLTSVMKVGSGSSDEIRAVYAFFNSLVTMIFIYFQVFIFLSVKVSYSNLLLCFFHLHS